MCPVAARTAAGRGRALGEKAGTTAGANGASPGPGGVKRRTMCIPNGSSSQIIIASIADARMNAAACTGKAPEITTFVSNPMRPKSLAGSIAAGAYVKEA